MNKTRNLLVALALAMPVAVVAHATKASPPDDQDMPTNPDTPSSKQTQSPDKQDTHDKYKQGQGVDEKQRAEVQGFLMPALIGIEAADMSAAALHELTKPTLEDNTSLRRTAKLAEEAVEIAQESAKDLSDMDGLSADARSQAKMAKNRLEQAHDSINRVQREVGVIRSTFGTEDTQQIRSEARKLHTQLVDAKSAMQSVAGRYNIQPQFQFPGDTQSVTP